MFVVLSGLILLCNILLSAVYFLEKNDLRYLRSVLVKDKKLRNIKYNLTNLVAGCN